MKIRYFLMLGLLSWALSTPTAQAQEQPTTAPIQQAMRLYDEAELHYQLQEWEKALEKYKEAYRLSREPEMLFNIGQCYRRLKMHDEAIKSYKAFQREAPDSPQKGNIDQLIKLSQEEQTKAELQAKEQHAATQTVIIREIAAAQPPLPTPEARPKKDGATRLYISSVGAMAGSFLFGGLALSARIAKDSAAINEDAEAFQAARKTTMGMSLASDALTVAAFGLGAVSYKKSPKKRISFALYGTAATSAIIGVSCGAAAFSASNKAGESSESTTSRTHDARAGALSNAADISLITAVVTGGLGVVLQLKTPKQEVVVTPTRGGVSVGLNF